MVRHTRVRGSSHACQKRVTRVSEVRHTCQRCVMTHLPHIMYGCRPVRGVSWFTSRTSCMDVDQGEVCYDSPPAHHVWLQTKVRCVMTHLPHIMYGCRRGWGASWLTSRTSCMAADQGEVCHDSPPAHHVWLQTRVPRSGGQTVGQITLIS